jgi:hypothetical protein
VGRHHHRRQRLGNRAGGIPGHSRENTFALLPQTVGGQKVKYIILDDASDPGTAV